MATSPTSGMSPPSHAVTDGQDNSISKSSDNAMLDGTPAGVGMTIAV